MTRINLLPYRNEKRKQRLIAFGFASVVAAAGGFAVVGFVYFALLGAIANQENRNNFLNEEIAKLDKQIAEIETLRQERQALLDRKKVIERLQSNRSQAVKIFDQLVRQVPDGVYLQEIMQTPTQLRLIGYAQSNARVSTLMHALNASSIFANPNLVEIKAEKNASGGRTSRFDLWVTVISEVSDKNTPAKTGKTTK